MAGNSITKQFNIGSATVMIGDMTNVLELTPAEHSIGLTKAFSLTSSTTEVTLTEGTMNREVDSQTTGIETTLSFEVYEYTAANLAWAAGVDGSEYVTGSSYKLNAAVTGGDSATSIEISSETNVSSKFPAGTKIQIQSDTENDKVLITVVSNATYDNDSKKLTITLTQPIPTGWKFDVNDNVFTCNIIPIGSEKKHPYVGVKIVGVLPNGNEPVTIIVPKAKITAGMTVNFQTDSYSNMPYEIKPYALTPEDDMYETFKSMDSIANCYIFKR